MSNGWILLHRKLLDWEWYTDSNTLHLFLHCLLKANHAEKKWHGTTVMPGQFITSRDHLSKETRLSIQNVRTSLNKLKSTGELTIKTTNKYSMISITNWNQYQATNQQDNKQLTNNQPTTNQQLTTNNNDNNDNNEKKEDISGSIAPVNGVPYQNIINLYNEILPELPTCKMLTTARKGHIRQRWLKDMPAIDNWKNYFNYVKQSPFLMGMVPTKDGTKPFRADIDWIIKESNFAKIYEGKYHGQI